MGKTLLSLFTALLLTACIDKDKFTTEVLFDNGWHFLRIDEGLSESDSLSYISGIIPIEADTVVLPHSPKIEPLVVNDQWQGTCFYFKKLALTKEDLTKRIALRFDGAMNVADVWVNGIHVKRHIGGYLPFEVVLDGNIQEGDNSIVVCLDNRDNKTTGPNPLTILDFNTYGGLYRHVWLMKNEKVMITRSTEGYSDAGVTFRTLKIKEDFAETLVRIDVKNISKENCDMLLDIEIVDEEGIEVAQCQVDTIMPAGERAMLARVLEIDDVRLWSPASPNLYTLRISLRDGETLVDRYQKKIGVRSFEIKNRDILINGEKVRLRGCNRHQEYPYVGYALSDKAHWRDAWSIKQAGFNLVRSQNYPASESFLEACDAYGIVVIEPILGWRYFGDKAFEAHALHSAREMIRRDRNHPSILAWELSVHESYMPKSFLEALAPLRDREAPGSYISGEDKDAFDIVEADNLTIDKVSAVNKPLIISQYGDESRQLREDGDDSMVQQVEYVKAAHEENFRNNKVAADIYWTMFDYNRGNAYSLEYAGLADIFRVPKYAYSYFASLSGNNPELSERSIHKNRPYKLEDGPIMSELEEKKDIQIYYVDIEKEKGTLDYVSEKAVAWSIKGDAYIVDPEQGMVKKATAKSVGGISSVVIEKYGKFSISAESVGNEIVSE